MATTNDRSMNRRSNALISKIQEFLDDGGQPTGILSTDEDVQRAIQALTPEKRKMLVDRLDQLHPTLDVQNAEFLNALGTVCAASNQPPTSATITTGLEKCGATPITSGGLTDVWSGVHDGKQVIIRAFRVYPKKNMCEAKKIVLRRVVLWKRFDHPNVNPFLGIAAQHQPLALVYDCAEHGNITKYIKSRPDPPLRSTLMLEVAKGLQYLHLHGVPHGNLKGANVLIDKHGHVRLTDYGFAPINSQIVLTAVDPAAGNTVWPAPEIVTGEVYESEPADVFAFAMLAFEILTGQLPFEGKGLSRAANLIQKGDRPRFPQNAEDVGLTARMQGFLGRCWCREPTERPKIDEVVRTWERLLENDEPVRKLSIDQKRLESTSDEDYPVDVTQPPRLDSRRRKFWSKFCCGLT